MNEKSQWAFGGLWDYSGIPPKFSTLLVSSLLKSKLSVKKYMKQMWSTCVTVLLMIKINWVAFSFQRTFGMDERIAWGHFTIPQRVFEGDALDDWWPLSGKQGEQKYPLHTLRKASHIFYAVFEQGRNDRVSVFLWGRSTGSILRSWRYGYGDQSRQSLRSASYGATWCRYADAVSSAGSG